MNLFYYLSAKVFHAMHIISYFISIFYLLLSHKKIMCGVFGYIDNKGVFSDESLKAMSQLLKHRGPDAEGFFIHKNTGLGHRRLSIIDLSTTANQPMHSHCGRYVMIFNGEIYNYLEITEELKKQNPTIFFNTHSDTEVILEAFTVWGKDFVNKLNGMFVIVIFDKQEKTLLLFRDRIGIKPLYYYLTNNCFVFASELKAISRLPEIREQLQTEYKAINYFLHLGYIPEPYSIYKNIFKFPAGSYAEIATHSTLPEKLKTTSFWKAENKILSEVITNEHEAKEKLKELLISSVRYRMISDVPFGTFLSGGVDSSLVTAIAQSISGNSVKTFSIGFEESSFNEAPYARAVAEYLGTDHHEFFVKEQQAFDLIPEIPSVYDEPFADSSAIPTMLVSKLAKEHVTMTLSGDGGDELFMGYGAYNWAERLNNPLTQTFRKPLSSILSMGGDKYKHAAWVLNYPDKKHLPSHIFSQDQYLFSRKEISKLLDPDILRETEMEETFPHLSRKLDPSEQQALFDLNYYLKDDLLVKVDRASMHYALETRVPLLDYRIIEFALNLSPQLRKQGKTTKYLLKQVLYDFVPEKYFNRPKRGFALPILEWIHNTELKTESSSFDVFNKKALEKYNAKHLSDNKWIYFNKKWLLYLLGMYSW
jgi:asparagine synthase (glutamine-hydrolysing)